MPKQYVKLSEAEKKARAILRREEREKARAVPKTNGRPKAEIEIDKVRALAKIGCTDKEIAAVLGVNVSTLNNRKKSEPEIAAAIEQGREMGKIKLREIQWRHAEGEGGPAVNMAIHLGKHELGQVDKPTHSTVDVNVEINSSWDRISAKLDEMQRRMLTQQQPLPQLEIIDVEPERVESGVAVDATSRGADSLPAEPVEGGGS